jgi:hypothetical protein
MESTLTEISKQHKFFYSSGRENDPNFQRTQDGISQITLQLKPVQDFEQELEKKITNILALESPPKLL